MKVTLQTRTTERSFDCGGDEMILHAGLRQGFNLPYECATGTCGTCRARVVSGEVATQWKEAPGIAKIKPDKGEILMCQSHAQTDCVLRVPPDPALEVKHHPALRQGTIRNIKQLTHDVLHFDVALSAPIDFEAGQFVVLDTGGIEGGRAYSVVSYGAGEQIALVVKRKPGGKFSDWLFDQRPGDRPVRVFGPLGRAIFRPQEGKNILCIAGGSGIAGMMSILECAVKSGHFRDHKGYVFFGVRTIKDMFYLAELSRLVDGAHGNLEVTIALSDEVPAGASPEGFPNLKFAGGFVHEVAMKAMTGRFDKIMAYLAGPPVMVDGAMRALIVGGLSARDIRYDKFS